MVGSNVTKSVKPFIVDAQGQGNCLARKVLDALAEAIGKYFIQK